MSAVTIAGLSADLRGPASFTFHELKHATGNFSDQNKLGQGGFATVYKVIFSSRALLLRSDVHGR